MKMNLWALIVSKLKGRKLLTMKLQLSFASEWLKELCEVFCKQSETTFKTVTTSY